MITSKPDVKLDDRLSIKDAAIALDMSRAWIYQQVKLGKIKTNVRKINGFQFIKGSEIIKIWESHY